MTDIEQMASDIANEKYNLMQNPGYAERHWGAYHGALAMAKAMQDDISKDVMSDTRGVNDIWVSVEDRLPEEGQTCLWFCDWDIGDRYRLHTMPKDFVSIPANGTHWMPLPQPPKVAELKRVHCEGIGDNDGFFELEVE